jgi:FMN phosphatase YigB (HAD superfamily)
MAWTFDGKLRATIEAPLGPMAERPDTRVVAREGWFQRITPSTPTQHHEVLLSVVGEADADRVIDEVVAEYRGVYRALVARLAFLRERGIAYAVTNAREATSAPMLEHLGFETLFRGACYELAP